MQYVHILIMHILLLSFDSILLEQKLLDNSQFRKSESHTAECAYVDQEQYGWRGCSLDEPNSRYTMLLLPVDTTNTLLLWKLIISDYSRYLS